jgi:hypothetical protein
MTAITKEELAIYDEISRLGESLWDASLKVVGLNRDPKMFSVMLFKRLWSNHRGYTLLHNNGLSLEADTILRSGLEAAICIAANYQLRDEFVILIRSDAAFTLRGQIKVHRESGANDLIKDGEANFRSLQASLPEGTKPARLNWNTLAQQGKVSQLYGFHRFLSGVSSHVTGMSLLKGVIDVDGSGADTQGELRKLSKRTHLMMMAGATLQGSVLHAAMIDDVEHAQAAKRLLDQLEVISTVWP